MSTDPSLLPAAPTPDPDRAVALRMGFPEVPGHELSLVWRRMDGDLSLYHRALRLFDNELARVLPLLDSQLRQPDLHSLRLLLHRLKGSSGMVACTEIQLQSAWLEERLLKLEDALRGAAPARLPDDVQLALEQLRARCEQQRTVLSTVASEEASIKEAGVSLIDGVQGLAMAAGPSRSAAAPTLGQRCRESLITLLAKLDRRDLEAVQDFEHLSPCCLSVIGPDALHVLRRTIESLDFAKAAEQVRTALQELAAIHPRSQPIPGAES